MERRGEKKSRLTVILTAALSAALLSACFDDIEQAPVAQENVAASTTPTVPTPSPTAPTPANTAPVASMGAVTTSEDSTLSITLEASDADGDSLTYTVVAQPTNGNLSGTASNRIYTPNGDFYGTDSFTFKANDGFVDSNIATVSITVTPVNDPPVADDGTTITNEDTSVGITLSASDIEGDSINFIVVDQPSNGTVSINGNVASYTPNSNTNGMDGFNFKAYDGTAD
ncbi:MAG: tandem-95 repeat protein, partial [Planctomycetes bacterium]|nr:tandem-95 repeat protein [Planctomycetota bacterium]